MYVPTTEDWLTSPTQARAGSAPGYPPPGTRPSGTTPTASPAAPRVRLPPVLVIASSHADSTCTWHAGKATSAAATAAVGDEVKREEQHREDRSRKPSAATTATTLSCWPSMNRWTTPLGSLNWSMTSWGSISVSNVSLRKSTCGDVRLGIRQQAGDLGAHQRADRTDETRTTSTPSRIAAVARLDASHDTPGG